MQTATLYRMPLSEITERIAFKTLLTFSKNGTPRRVPTRLYPIYSYEFDIAVADEVNADALAAIRQAYNVAWVPVYPHIRAVQPAPVGVDTGGTIRPMASTLTVLPAPAQAKFVAWAGSPYETEAVEYEGTLPGGLAAKYIAPAVQARISASPVISWQTSKFSVTRLVVEPLAMFETLSLPAPGSVRTLINPDWSASITETYTDTGALFETDYTAALVETYSRARTLQMTFTLISEQQINEFRAFLLVQRGRLNPLLFQAPGDLAASTWWLNTDVAEIQHINRNLATCTLSIYQLASL